MRNVPEDEKPSREKLPPEIQEYLDDRTTIYTLQPQEWTRVGGYQVKLVEVPEHKDKPARLILRYPTFSTPFFRIRNFFAFLQKGFWVYDWSRIPNTKMLISKYPFDKYCPDGHYRKPYMYVATFIAGGGGPSVGG